MEAMMIVVDKSILFWKCIPSAIERCKAMLPHTATFQAVEDTPFWNDTFRILYRLDPTLSIVDMDEIHDIYMDWVKAPALIGADQGKFLFYSTDPGLGEHGAFLSVQQNTQEKSFPKVEHLYQALLGNYRAKDARRREERLAFAILGQLQVYEDLFLNTLISELHAVVTSKLKGNLYARGKSYYGDAATVDWRQENILQTMWDPEPLVRLYRKIAAIHDFCRACRFDTPGRGDHADMRLPNEKYSLNEEHPAVADDRLQGVSIWAGKSGSAMDMIFGAMQMGLTDPKLLLHLAYCIFAFFHFMPTVQSSTHTFHEVMRGAHSICPEIAFNPAILKVPDAPPPV
jgi:hypothetical protein